MPVGAFAEIAAGLLVARAAAGLETSGARPPPVPPLPRCEACGGRGLRLRLTPLPVTAGGAWACDPCHDCRTPNLR